MNFLQKMNPAWSLRLGLGIMYLYSGFDLFYHPSHWYGFVPKWFSQTVIQVAPIEAYLKIQGIGEMVIGLLFLAWFFGARGARIASALAMLEMAAILIFFGVDPITFRDIGLLGASAALFIMSFQSIHHGSRVTV